MLRDPRALLSLVVMLTPSPTTMVMPTPTTAPTPGPRMMMVPTPSPTTMVTPTPMTAPTPGPRMTMAPLPTAPPPRILLTTGPTQGPTVVRVTIQIMKYRMTITCTLLRFMQVGHQMIALVWLFHVRTSVNSRYVLHLGSEGSWRSTSLFENPTDTRYSSAPGELIISSDITNA